MEEIYNELFFQELGKLAAESAHDVHEDAADLRSDSVLESAYDIVVEDHHETSGQWLKSFHRIPKVFQYAFLKGYFERIADLEK